MQVHMLPMQASTSKRVADFAISEVYILKMTHLLRRLWKLASVRAGGWIWSGVEWSVRVCRLTLSFGTIIVDGGHFYFSVYHVPVTKCGYSTILPYNTLSSKFSNATLMTGAIGQIEHPCKRYIEVRLRTNYLVPIKMVSNKNSTRKITKSSGPVNIKA
jgi:hypothetical protein